MEDYEHISLPEDDKISVEEIQDLIEKVRKFYEERGYIYFDKKGKERIKMSVMPLSNLIIKRLRSDRDYFVNTEGLRGTGKSNFILLLSLLQCRYSGLWRNKKTRKIVKVLPREKPLSEEWEHIEFGFQFRKNMSFLDSSEDVSKKFNSLDKYHPFIIDEGSKNLHKYEWNNKLQFLLVRMSDTERWQNKAIYVCFPNFKELNAAFRNDRILMRAFLYDRSKEEGYASLIISLRDVNRYVIDPWHTDENAKKFEFYLKKIPIALRSAKHILATEKRLLGYAGNFDVPSLEKIAPRIWDIYMKYKIFYAKKDQQTIDLLEEESIKVRKLKLKIRSLIEHVKSLEPDITNIRLQSLTGLSAPAFTKLLIETDKEIRKGEIRLKIPQTNP